MDKYVGIGALTGDKGAHLTNRQYSILKMWQFASYATENSVNTSCDVWAKLWYYKLRKNFSHQQIEILSNMDTFATEDINAPWFTNCDSCE